MEAKRALDESLAKEKSTSDIYASISGDVASLSLQVTSAQRNVTAYEDEVRRLEEALVTARGALTSSRGLLERLTANLSSLASTEQVCEVYAVFYITQNRDKDYACCVCCRLLRWTTRPRWTPAPPRRVPTPPSPQRKPHSRGSFRTMRPN